MAQVASAFTAALVSLCLAASLPAAAGELPSAPDRARAERLFRDGTAAFEAGEFSEAYAALRSAFDLEASYRTAGGLGQVELHLGQYRDAATHLAECLRRFPADGDPEARKHVEQGLDEAREHVAALRLRVDVEGASVSVDGVPVGVAPLEGVVFVAPGHRVVQAEAKGRESVRTEVDAPARATLEVALELGPASPAPAAPLEPASAVERKPGKRASVAAVHADAIPPSTWALVIGGAVTAVSGVTAVVFGLEGASAGREVNDLRAEIGAGGSCGAPSPALAAKCAELRDRADARNRDDTIALGLGITAGVAAAATLGTYFVLSRAGAERPATTALTVGLRPLPLGASVVLGGTL